MVHHEMIDGAVRIAHEDFGIFPQHIKVNIWKQPDRIFPADGAEYRRYIRIQKGIHQILCPQPGMAREKSAAAQCMGHTYGFQAKFLPKPFLRDFISVDKIRLSQSAPGEAYDGDAVAGPQPFRFDHVHIYLLMCILFVTAHPGLRKNCTGRARTARQKASGLSRSDWNGRMPLQFGQRLNYSFSWLQPRRIPLSLSRNARKISYSGWLQKFPSCTPFSTQMKPTSAPAFSRSETRRSL